jgi:TonB family protein
VPPLPVPVPEPEIKPIELPSIALPVLDSIPKIAVTPITGSGTGQGSGAGDGNGSGTGGGSGTGSGGGNGDGIGSGTGPGTGRGRLLAPSPEVLLIPPPAPGSVRGKSVVVRLEVDSTGVVRSAQILPSTGDRKYDSALRRVALGWKFRAARDPENRPVATLFDVTFVF